MPYIPKDRNSGIAIFDKIEDKYIFLLGSKGKNENRIYEFFGGHCEKQDISSLHTAVRETIEELFNIKLDTVDINRLVQKMVQSNDIRYDLTFENKKGGITYFIGFRALEKMYNFIKYNKYKKVESFDLIEYMKHRTIKNNASNGLNEMNSLHFEYLDNISKLKLRDYASYVLEHIKKNLK